ncbi:MAG: hypothetical protein KatS3mg109_0109 [Pirellulaceae bacterium]|nr:MAG: hypothetical protein KatS3mg109_0109 [Pirellulaceae bacterium]
MAVQVEKVGRRFYITGDTYPVKDKIADAGCTWDEERRAWWTGKKEVADQLEKELSGEGGVCPSRSVGSSGGAASGGGDDQVVAGKVKYKGRTYYVCGRVQRGQTRWERDQVSWVTTKDGRRVLLSFMDGSKTFWVDRQLVETIKSYRTPQTIGELKRFAERTKSNEPRCAECGGFGNLVRDLEDGMLKHPKCCDIPPA